MAFKIGFEGSIYISLLSKQIEVEDWSSRSGLRALKGRAFELLKIRAFKFPPPGTKKLFKCPGGGGGGNIEVSN